MATQYNKLDSRVQKWIYKQGWKDLREVQKLSIDPILKANCDIVISAATAAGKTEAAFMPALTTTADIQTGFGILYISPLKALINDQHRRLEPLAETMDLKVTAWHGDSSVTKKKQVILKPNGVILITPESLESMLILRAGWVKKSFENIKYIIIDEYHAFLGSERGTQLQSLMHRLEDILELDRKIPRIALSATLGDMDSVLKSLRPDNSFPSILIEPTDPNEVKSSMLMQVRGYIEKIVKVEEAIENPEEYVEKTVSSDDQIAADLFTLLRGDSHLVFANSRKRTENFSALLSDLCRDNGVPNEFFPHHGSLSKEIRFDLESRLQRDSLPTTAVCTMTLELGIDIGKVKSVSQVTAPLSVSSLRQRLGRSGRRGDNPVLRMFISENELMVNSSIVDKLRLELLQSIAVLRLLIIEKWYEPADTDLYHFSTLIHQILAVISQWGGVRADRIWQLLCKSGSFNKITVDQFSQLLTFMGDKNLISQLSSGELTIGESGERLVNHYTFYAVFNTPEEYRVIVKGRTIGSIPLDSFVVNQQYIIFSGRRWKVIDIDNDKKVITLEASEGGKPPKFSNGSLIIHDKIRQEMLKVYTLADHRIDIGSRKIEFMDDTAINLFNEGVKLFQELELSKNRLTSHGRHVYLIPWMGDKVVNTLSILLITAGYKLSNFAGVIEIENSDIEDVRESLILFSLDNKFTNADLAKYVENKELEKFDKLLPENLLEIEYGAKAFNISRTIIWLKNEISNKCI
ncbi:MAG: DEAD/DEAH box helicase [Spirochaetaceae bacterium]